MSMLEHAGLVAVKIILFAAVARVVYLLWRRREAKLVAAADRWAERGRMGEAEFLEGCGLTGDGLEKTVALAARRVIAEIVLVPPETIWPEDRWKDYGCLMDSVDWLDFIFRIEKGAWVKVRARDWEGDQVRDFVRAVSLTAKELPPVTKSGLRKEDYVGR